MHTPGRKLRIAMLEDDPDQAEIVNLWLEDDGFSVAHRPDSSAFLRLIRHDSFDLYFLDWVVPGMSGIEVLRKVRREMNDKTPVVIATVKNEEQNIVRALNAGADDYLVKPVRRGELLARLRAVLRRTGVGNHGTDTTVDAEPYHFNMTQQSVQLRTERVELTNKEFELAVFLFRNPGKLLSRNHILEAIWGIDNAEVSTRTVDTHVSRLRKKLELGSDNGWKLSSVYQHGYRLEAVALQAEAGSA
ncbi:MAG: response regulator transcription factor [Pseudomonadota bacterium]